LHNRLTTRTFLPTTTETNQVASLFAHASPSTTPNANGITAYEYYASRGGQLDPESAKKLQGLSNDEDAVDDEEAKADKEFSKQRLREIHRSDDAQNDLFNEAWKNQLARIQEGERKVFEEQVRSRNVQGSITKRKRDRVVSQKQAIICRSSAGRPSESK
jgi:hypothetical protein